jgi:hypothetical protein
MKLKPGKAVLRKKPIDKAKIIEVDKKAQEEAIFIETFEMYDAKWNKFEDPRGWIWHQLSD